MAGFERTDAAYAVGEREVVSTIEEAREQARTALNSATVARRYSVHPDAGTLERALRALLDATEPPAEDERPCNLPSNAPPCVGCKHGCKMYPLPVEDEREAAYLEADRRWPSPNSGLYEGLRIGFQKGAEWAKEPRPITDEIEYQVRDVHGEVWAWADTF